MSHTSIEYGSEEEIVMCHIKAVSVPIVQLQKPSGATLKEQISAPSYFHSLKENEAPPFKKPGKEEKPRLLLDSLIEEDDVVKMIAALDKENDYIGFKKQLGCTLYFNRVGTLTQESSK
ncbi:jg24052 [Pararge aegeria aegeria]|uniref:Jg24052 protein n=1 Tax=Pararge aegeria aegeria TaxID=348720 RepID=A0A8S4RYE6_9NEOP|nr:jg24052 [Pararge aegeria aegeria]